MQKKLNHEDLKIKIEELRAYSEAAAAAIAFIKVQKKLNPEDLKISIFTLNGIHLQSIIHKPTGIEIRFETDQYYKRGRIEALEQLYENINNQNQKEHKE